MDTQVTDGEVIRVVIVDDHPLVAHGLKEILEKHGSIQVIGSAKDLPGLLSIYQTQPPDVVLMDVAMPQQDGIAVTRALLEQHPDAAVLMLTSYEDEATVVAALDAGAKGFLLKKAEVNEMISAIQATFQGKRSLSPDALEALIRARTTTRHPNDELTEREQDVLQLLVQGMTNPQIAGQLHITISTVKFHVGAIFKKLDVSTRTEAVSKAVHDKLI